MLKADWIQNLDSTDYSYETLHVEMKPYKVYLLVSNDFGDIYSDMNYIMPAVEVTFSENGKDYTMYQYIKIPSVYKDKDGAIHGSFQYVRSCDESVWSESAGMESGFSIYAYETILAMESSLDRDGYSQVK